MIMATILSTSNRDVDMPDSVRHATGGQQSDTEDVISY